MFAPSRGRWSPSARHAASRSPRTGRRRPAARRRLVLECLEDRAVPSTVTFAPATSYAAGNSPYNGPYSVAVGDFNGDGKPDLAVANQYAYTVSVLLNSGNGTFAAATSYAVGS